MLIFDSSTDAPPIDALSSQYTGQFVALKFISKGGKTEADLSALRSEIAILRGLDHPNIILLLDYFETPRDVVVVTEYAHGELFQILQVGLVPCLLACLPFPTRFTAYRRRCPSCSAVPCAGVLLDSITAG